MVKKYACSFCGMDIEPGTGMIYVRNDGVLLYFCSSKCRRNALLLRRRARKLKWTEVYEGRLRRAAKAAKARKARAKRTAKKKATTSGSSPRSPSSKTGKD